MERDHGFGLARRPGTPQDRPSAAKGEAGHEAEGQQYRYEFKGIYDQIADVVAGARNALVQGDFRLVADLRQQPFGVVGTGRLEHHCHERTRPFHHGPQNPLEIHNPFTGNLRGRV